ncbi:MAG: class I SAM-dependent methyltransferase [Deltaproteobacteria bacterium]|nr:MAG: class I SAM-dependent methyltransferase [Deltaproteobacteria bacterium]
MARFPSDPRPARKLDESGEFDLDAATREHYADAVLYDYEYRRRRADVNFYRQLARDLRAEDVLDLACGSGRVTLPLARDGRRVVGIDLAAPMLARAAERAGRLGRAARQRVQFVRADMRRFALRRRFSLIVSAFNSIEHLYTRVDLAACLSCVRAHLAPGGRFAFDVQNPDLQWLTRDPRKRWARTRFTDPRTGARVEYTTNHVYDPISQIAFIRLYYRPLDETDGPARPSVVRLAQRKYFPAELEALLAANGFAVEARYGGFAREPLDGPSESQVIVCVPVGDRSGLDVRPVE